MSTGGSNWMSISFKSLISGYKKLQAELLKQIKSIAKSASSASPGKFLLLQFTMSNVTQVGESISNLVSQVMSVINNAIRNQKGS